jgi:hypothetical protein
VVVRNHGHLGGAGYHAQLAADANMMGHCFHAPGQTSAQRGHQADYAFSSLKSTGLAQNSQVGPEV